ncbi:MAG TPA: alpha/beta hydrolase [Candidatus Saccharimonadales bacterium]
MITNKIIKTARLSALSIALASCPLTLTAPAYAGSPTDLPGNSTCQNLQIPVALNDGEATNYTISGTYCTPRHWAGNQQRVDVLIHGGTYSQSYWDFPAGQQYSYVFRTLQAGRATFAYDQIGTGTSSHPLSTSVTANGAAYVAHQVVQHFRSTGKGVNIVGHSIGAYLAIREAGTYHDVDAVVVTGALHVPEVLPTVGAEFNADMYPATSDPLFAGQNLDAGYLTTTPGTRASLFYDTRFADAKVITADEAHKAFMSATLAYDTLADLATPAAYNISQSVTAPVLIIVGANDSVMCTAGVDCSRAGILARERAFFPNAASLSAISVANTGHDLTLHYSAPYSFGLINSWLNSR